MPVNALIIRALMHYFSYYGDNFKIECPTGSGNLMNLFEVAHEIVNRLTRMFLRDENGRRPVFGGAEKFQRDPYWRDNLLFYEYFHGDNGAGIGASHQTGWTGVIALGGETALAQFREKLARRDIKLLLDFVPNHTAPDHVWVKTHPDYYMEGSEEALAGAPQNYLRVETDRGSKILAYGRDPNFRDGPIPCS
jgi:Alpha amylase, catalytic domain